MRPSRDWFGPRATTRRAAGPGPARVSGSAGTPGAADASEGAGAAAGPSGLSRLFRAAGSRGSGPSGPSGRGSARTPGSASGRADRRTNAADLPGASAEAPGTGTGPGTVPGTGRARRRGGRAERPELDVAVVGAGIAGLTAAYRLRQQGRSVQVFEASDRVGGRMAVTRTDDGFLIDEGAETIAARGYDATWALIRDVGLPRDAVEPIRAGFAVWRDGAAHAHLGHPRGLLSGAGLSGRARRSWLRFAWELASRRAEFDPDRPEASPLGRTTLAELGQSYHPDLYDYLLQPLSGHCFGWRGERTTAAPLLASMLAAGGVGARWLTYADGMDTLARAVAAQLPQVALNSPLQQLVRTEQGSVRLEFADRSRVTARQVLLAVPAPLALALDPDPAPEARRYLDACGFTPMLKVACLLDRPLPGPTRAPSYALSVPVRESRLCSGLLLDHLKAPGRVPPGAGLVTVFASPWAAPELLCLPDHEVAARLTAEAERFLPGLGAATRRTLVHRFRHGLPEATPAALAVRPRFAARPAGPVEYAGDWTLLRPSSEGAIRSGDLAAQRLALAAPTARTPNRAPARHR